MEASVGWVLLATATGYVRREGPVTFLVTP